MDHSVKLRFFSSPLHSIQRALHANSALVKRRSQRAHTHTHEHNQIKRSRVNSRERFKFFVRGCFLTEAETRKKVPGMCTLEAKARLAEDSQA